MARTLILNVSAEAQVLPAIYGGFVVSVGHGRVVSDESSVAVAELGGFEAMDGKWAVSAISTDTALGDFDVASNGVALLATFVPSGGGGGGSGGPVAWSDVTSKPSFAAVATSGAYADLSGKPALADVATSGLYSDLSGTPTLPTAGNTAATTVSSTAAAGVQAAYARVDHQHAHGNLAGGSMHSEATTVAAGFMSASDKLKLDGLATVASSGAYADLSGAPALAAVATSGDYADLSGKPSLFDGAYASLTGKPTLFDGAYASLTDAPVLATVATSGAYADLSGKPALFDGAYGSLTGAPSLATVATSGAYADLSGKPTLATVATSGSASDLSNQPYDIIGNGAGSLAVGKVIMTAPAPRALVLESIQQGAGATAQVTIKVNGVAASYPQNVAAGALITAVISTAGTDCYFSITGKVA